MGELIPILPKVGETCEERGHALCGDDHHPGPIERCGHCDGIRDGDQSEHCPHCGALANWGICLVCEASMVAAGVPI